MIVKAANDLAMGKLKKLGPLPDSETLAAKIVDYTYNKYNEDRVYTVHDANRLSGKVVSLLGNNGFDYHVSVASNKPGGHVTLDAQGIAFANADKIKEFKRTVNAGIVTASKPLKTMAGNVIPWKDKEFKSNAYDCHFAPGTKLRLGDLGNSEVFLNDQTEVEINKHTSMGELIVRGTGLSADQATTLHIKDIADFKNIRISTRPREFAFDTGLFDTASKVIEYSAFDENEPFKNRVVLLENNGNPIKVTPTNVNAVFTDVNGQSSGLVTLVKDGKFTFENDKELQDLIKAGVEKNQKKLPADPLPPDLDRLKNQVMVSPSSFPRKTGPGLLSK